MYEYPRLENPTREIVESTPPKTYTPHGSQSSDDNLGRKSDRGRTF